MANKRQEPFLWSHSKEIICKESFYVKDNSFPSLSFVEAKAPSQVISFNSNAPFVTVVRLRPILILLILNQPIAFFIYSLRH